MGRKRKISHQYNIGDVLIPKETYKGFDKVKIYRIDERLYHCKIMNGIATIPIYTLENDYILSNNN